VIDIQHPKVLFVPNAVSQENCASIGDTVVIKEKHMKSDVRLERERQLFDRKII
jgi:hypothetical protein